MGPPSPVKSDSGPGSVPLFLGLGAFQDRVSPDITSYILKVGSAPSYPHHPSQRKKGKRFELRYKMKGET